MRRFRTIWRWLLPLLPLLLTPLSPVLAQTAVQVAPLRPFVQYTTADGMTQAQASAFAQDEAGYLWFTTSRGLNRFDGREFVHLTISDGLRTNELTTIEMLPHNTVLVGDNDGYLTIIRDSKVVRSISPPAGIHAAITDIAVCQRDRLCRA